MAAEIVTLLVAGTLLLLLVVMFRQRDGLADGQVPLDAAGAHVWNGAVASRGSNFSDAGASPLRPDPDAAGREVLDHLRQLEERSPGLIAQVIPVFLKDTAQRLASLKNAVKQQDSNAAHRLAHTLHGSAASVGAASMVRACAEIIREVRLGAFDGCDRLIAALDADFDSIQQAAAEAMRGGDAA